MPDTHINAYFADVEEKQVAVKVAQGELQAAKDRLAVKKKQVDWQEPVSEPEVVEDQIEDSKPNTGSVFKKNK